MQWKDDVSNDDIKAVNASSTTKIKYGNTSSEAVKTSTSHVLCKKMTRERDKKEEKNG